MSIQQMFDPVLNEAVALERLREVILDPMNGDGMNNARGLLKTVRAAMKHGPSAVTVAALCLLSSDKVADEKLTDVAVLSIFKRSLHEHADTIGNVCLGDMFDDWCAATSFNPTAIDVVGAHQSVDNYNALEELWRLCVRGRAQSGICLLKSAWLQRQSDEARRLPSRNALPRDAVYSGPITQESVFIIALSYCWATREHPDPENKLLADVCEVLKYLDTSRHFGDHDAAIRAKNIGEREVLVFWDYPCLYQKGDTSTNGITLLQRDSFERGLDSINILYGHVGTLSLLCTKHYADPTTRMPYQDSAWPYFEMLVSTLIKPADKGVNLPIALEWIGAKASDIASGHRGHQSNCSLYWLYDHARRRERRLPVPPEQFNEDIVGKKATNGSDRQILINKFKQTFDAVMAPAQKLQLANVPGPNASEWHLFLTKTLRSCTALVHVVLSRNEAIAGVTLEVFSHLNGTLNFLCLTNCVGFGGSLQPLRRFLKLKFLCLPGCLSLEGSLEPLQYLQDLATLNVEACFGLVDGLEQLSSLPKLQILHVCDTALAQAAFVERRRQALDAEVCTDGGALVVGGCRVGRYDVEQTPLWFAANDGQVQVARGLVAGRGGRGGVEVDRARADGLGTPLLQASTQGFVDIAKVLLTHRADADKPRDDGVTPLLFAAQYGFVDVAKLLLDHRADANKPRRDGTTPLHWAAQKGLVDIAKLLLAHRADPNKPRDDHVTPLQFAAQEGFVDIAKLLLAHRADPNKPRDDGGTPLLWAAQEGFVDVAKVLLENGADVNRTDAKRQTPLNKASWKGHVDVVRLLLRQNADVTVEDQWGKDALASAREEGHREVVQLLVEAQRRQE